MAQVARARGLCARVSLDANVLQVSQAALLKRRVGYDEQRSTPESDGGLAAAEIDDNGSM